MRFTPCNLIEAAGTSEGGWPQAGGDAGGLPQPAASLSLRCNSVLRVPQHLRRLSFEVLMRLFFSSDS